MRRAKNLKRNYKIIIFIFVNFLLLSQSLSVFAISREYKIKAAFLFHFTDFVQWPASKDQYVIGVLGLDPFEGYLNTLAKQILKQKNKTIIVKYYKTFDEIDIPEILFIGDDVDIKINKMISIIDSKPILTVSENKIITQRCGIVRIFTKKRKVRLEINQQRAKAQKLKISHKLLRLAKIIDQNKDICKEQH